MENHELENIDDSTGIAVKPDTTADNGAESVNIESAAEGLEHLKLEPNGEFVHETEAKDANNGEEHDMPDGSHENGNTFEDDIGAALAVADAPKKKKKKKTKTKGQKIAKIGTGFEEYYVDAPLKPEEHEEEKGLYHASLAFAQRIETAIQRFAKKRNMDSTRKNIFDKYLAQGGIDSGPKPFSGGIDSETLAIGDAQDIARLTATSFVPFDAADSRNGLYEVDFEGCLKSFLSYTVPCHFDLESEAHIKSLINIIRNFLNYLLHHDVCPEYDEQIKASKRLCDQAERELWAISQCIVDMPGTFNKACSELYGGIFQGQWAAASTWISEDESNDISQGMSPALARQIFKLAIVANTSEEQFKEYEAQNSGKGISITKIYDLSMEVVETIPSGADAQNLYASRGDLEPVGKLKTKTWHTPFAPPEDLTEEEEAVLADKPPVTKFYEFWVEDSILLNCFPGMKLDVTVTELSIGVSYFDKIHGIYCSFFDISPNARMQDWREPEGEGNWLPMRAKGGGPLEDEDEADGPDGDTSDKKLLGSSAKEATGNTESTTEDVKDEIDGSGPGPVENGA